MDVVFTKIIAEGTGSPGTSDALRLLAEPLLAQA